LFFLFSIHCLFLSFQNTQPRYYLNGLYKELCDLKNQVYFCTRKFKVTKLTE
jgi:hypothetical protein